MTNLLFYVMWAVYPSPPAQVRQLCRSSMIWQQEFQTGNSKTALVLIFSTFAVLLQFLRVSVSQARLSYV